MELQEDEDADSFFDRFRELTESEPEDDATAELDLEELKKESSVLGRLADKNAQKEPEKTPAQTGSSDGAFNIPEVLSKETLSQDPDKQEPDKEEEEEEADG